MELEIGNQAVKIDEQGYLLNLDDWSEEFVEKTAERDGIQLYDDHWGLILYFRDYYHETGTTPTMRLVVRSLGRQHGPRFRDAKAYEKYLYQLFPTDPIRALCKLAGLPKPTPDT